MKRAEKIIFQLIILFIISSWSINTFSQITFAPFQATTTGSFPEVVAIGDLNNDGLNDVALATSFYFDPPNDFKLFAFLQNASGNLQAPVKYSYTYSNNSYVSSISIGDLNSDGKDDVVLGFGDSVGIFFQNGIGQLNPIISFYSGQTVDGVKAGDLNNDGLKDIAVSHWNDPFIRIFYQTGTGFTSSTYNSPQSGYDEIDVGDVNSDGLNDVVFLAGQSFSGIHVFTQTVSGGLNNYVSYYASPSPFSSLDAVAIGDLNNDGKNDVAATGYANSPNARVVLWFQNPSTGLLGNQAQLISYDCPEPIEISDLNCDGKNEIIIGNGGWMKATVFEQNISGQYTNYSSYNLPYASHYEPQGLVIGDVNNDGAKDIAIADYNNGLILLKNTSAVSTINISTNSASGGTSVCIGQPITLSANGAAGYSWAPASSLNSATGSTVIASPSANTSYTVTGTNSCGNTFSDTLTVNVYSFPVATINSNSTICSGETVTLSASGGALYSWNTGHTTPSIVVLPGSNTTYSVSVSNGYCSDDTSTSVFVNPKPLASTSGNVTIYQGQTTTLTASGGTIYLWDNGETATAISVSPMAATAYCVTVVDTNNCKDTTCVLVDVKSPCDTAGTFYFPNAFSPNEDGENDFFRIYYRNMDCIESLYLIIYDRWGEKVYETTDKNFKWDGKLNNTEIRSKVLACYLHVKFTEGDELNRRGNISVIR